MRPPETTFRLPTHSRIARLVAYIVAVPVVAIMLGPMVGFAVMVVAAHLRVHDLVVVLAGIVVYVSLVVWFVRFAIRDYRRRAGSVLVLGNDSLSGNDQGSKVFVPFDNVLGIRLVPHRHDAQCVLDLSSGGRFRLPLAIAPFSKVQGALAVTLVPRLADRLSEKIAAGSPIRVNESSLRAWLGIAKGVLTLAGGALVMSTVRGIPIGIRLLKGGWLHIRRGWRGRGVDFHVTREGLRPTGAMGPSDLHAWKDLRTLTSDQAGLVLGFEDGRVLTASIFAENYWPFAEWIGQVWGRACASGREETGQAVAP